MGNNILGGLVIFVVVVTCLLLLDDISNPQPAQTTVETVAPEKMQNKNDLAVLEQEE